jgi:hypothetical protein
LNIIDAIRLHRFDTEGFDDEFSHSHSLDIQQRTRFESMLFFFVLFFSGYEMISLLVIGILFRSFSFFGTHAHISPMGAQNTGWWKCNFDVNNIDMIFSFEFFSSYRSSFIRITNAWSYSTFKWRFKISKF